MFYLRIIFLLIISTFKSNESIAEGLPDTTWPAGTQLARLTDGGRINTFHRGYLYLGGLDKTTIWDISDPQSPVLVGTSDMGDNGHSWAKVGDLFSRGYRNPELIWTDPYQFMDNSDMLNRVPWTAAEEMSFPIDWTYNGFFMTFPLSLYQGITDVRSGVKLSTVDVYDDGVYTENDFRIGNLLFLTPGDNGEGMSVWDIGDPANPVLLDVLSDNINQYSNGWQVWRNYIVLSLGDRINGPDRDSNALVIDYSDPTDLKVAFTLPFDTTRGRYMQFQDEFMFVGRGNVGYKINMLNQEVVQTFETATDEEWFGDFQWEPLGHLLVISSSEAGGDDETHIFAHQDGLDSNPPSVGYHLPVDGATNQPVTTVIGLVINETLDDITINDQTIQVKPVSGDSISGTVVSTQHDVINFVPNSPLLADTTYEVLLVANGIRDVAGNGIEEYSFQFSTGSEIIASGRPQIQQISTSPNSPIEVGQNILFTVTATDPDGDPLEYQFDFGDGTSVTTWNTSNQNNHVFAFVGTYNIVIKVRDSNQNTVTETLSMVVQDVAGPVAPQSNVIISSSTLNRVWTVNPDNDSLTAINSNTFDSVYEVNVCQRPSSLALDQSSQIWITCQDDDKLVIVNATTGVQINELSLGRGSAPTNIVISLDGLTAYVAESGSQSLSKISTSSLSVTQTLSLTNQPQALALTTDGSTLYVTRFLADKNGNTVWKIETNSLTLSQSIALEADTTTPDSSSRGRGVFNYLNSIALNSSGDRAWLPATKSNVFRGQFLEGTDLNFENTARAAITSLNLTNDQELVSQRVDIDNHSQPSSVTLGSGSALLFTTMRGNDRLIVLDSLTGDEIMRTDTGKAPDGIVIDSATSRIFVKNFLSRDISVFDGSNLLSNGQAELPLLATVSTVSNETLTSEVLLGKQVFYNARDLRMSEEGYISCSTCHLNGDQDGQVWDSTQLGEGMRNTTSLMGRRGMGHGLVHWSGNFDEIQDFEHPIRAQFGGQGFLSNSEFNRGTTSSPLGDRKAGYSAELDALASYVTSLDTFAKSPYREANGSLTAQGLAGKDLFTNLSCQMCHQGNDFTDSNTGRFHDVGTIIPSSGERLGQSLLGVDTPTLRGIWKTAPYLHDGSAATLGDVLTTKNTDDQHGMVSTLTAGQRQDLISYLKQIDHSEPAIVDDSILTLVSPLENESINEGESVVFKINTNFRNVSEVNYFVNGNQVATSHSAPDYAATWSGNAGQKYEVLAKVSHNNRLNSFSSRRNIQYLGSQPSCVADGALRYETWRGITGSEITDLTSNSNYPDSPSTTGILNATFLSPQDVADDFGSRISGLLCAPVSGEYTFWVAGDDQVQLRLSTDSNPDNASVIAYHNEYTGVNEWDKYPIQKSAAITLEAGQTYYIEALHKEGNSGDSLSVGWQLPDSTMERPIPVTYFSLPANSTLDPIGVEPVADAGPDQNVLVNQLVQLTATNSSDSDGTIVRYLWTQTAGVTVTLSSTSAEQPTFTAPRNEATLTFKLTVTDNDGLTKDDNVIINVGSLPIAVCDAGPSQNVNEFNNESGELSTVNLNASNSIISNGSIVSYLWKQLSGIDVTLASPNQVTSSFTTNEVDSSGASYTFEVTCTSDLGTQSTAEVIVNIIDVNLAPISNAGVTQQVNEGDTVTLDGRLSNDIDGDNLTYTWSLKSSSNGTGITLDSTTVVSPQFTAPDVDDTTGESFVFELIVNDGSLSDVSEVVIQVMGGIDSPPIADAGPDITADENHSVSLDGSNSSDAQGDVSYLWRQISGVQVNLSNSAQAVVSFTTPTVSNDPITLVFELTVTDSALNIHTDEVSVIVNNVIENPGVKKENSSGGGGSLYYMFIILLAFCRKRDKIWRCEC